MKVRLGHLVLFVVALLGLLAGCGGGGSGVNAPTIASQAPIAIEGYVQKGPFIGGQIVLIQEVDEDYDIIRPLFSVPTNDDMGGFSLGKSELPDVIEITATGLYFNEITGTVSDGSLTLWTLSETAEAINVNILTSLAEDRIKYLHSSAGGSKTYSNALAQAQEEIIRNVFGISTDVLSAADLSRFDKMNIAMDGKSNGVLLAASVVLQGAYAVGDLTGLINDIKFGIKTDGTLASTPSLPPKLKGNTQCLAPTTIRSNLETRYLTCIPPATTAVVPTFEDYLDTNGDGLVNSDDDIAPTVSPTSPTSGDASVELNSTVQAMFDKSMDSATIGSTTFIVASGGSPVVGSVSYNCATRAVTFTPDANLSSFTTYTATISSGVKDIGGHALVSNSWSFTTSDVVAPSVSSTSPLSSATAVDFNTNVTVTFSDANAIDALTVTASTFTLSTGGAPVAGTVSYDADTKTATFNPTVNFPRSTVYTATVTTGVKDAAENALAQDYTWSFTSDGWTVEELEVAIVGRDISIAIDGNDSAHISYYDLTHSSLDYATKNTNGVWDLITVDSVGWETSIAIDSNGHAHISYFDEDETNLKYATNASGAWVVDDPIDSDGIVGYYTAIAIDNDDKVHIAYYDGSNGDLKYVTGTFGIGNWSSIDVDPVDSDGNVGTWPSIAIDGDDKVHISYRDSGNGHLKYATGTFGSWDIDTVDSSANVGQDTSIAVDGNNKAHISYYDTDNQDLKYATNKTGSWGTPVIVDSAGDVGTYTSIAVDGDGSAHISYYDSSAIPTPDLNYATNASGAWVITTIDSAGNVGTHTSIAIDSNGRAHISYYDNTNSSLKYAH